MGLLGEQKDNDTWVDPESGLVFHNANYNWNNLNPEPKPTFEEYVVQDNLGTFTDITKPTFEEYVVEPDRSIFTDITPSKDIESNNNADYTAKRNAVNTGLQGINQFFHGVIDKEFDGGFMGFNPMNSMAHNAIGEHMRMYSNPDRITETMINNTRRMILEKAGSKLGPQKTQYILERFNQYVQQVKAYKGMK